MLSERQKLVLKTIVEEYVNTNEPVGSRTLSKLDWFNASPATLRNDMADLEDLGYLTKTHTSSGRVPSEKGYRFYVEEMMKKEKENNLEFPMIDDIFRRQDISREEAIERSMDLVSNLTNYTSIVLGKSAYNSRIKKLEFLTLQNHYNLSKEEILNEFHHLFKENDINNTDVQISLSHPDFEEENFCKNSRKTDCMYGRILTNNGVYSCPFLSNDYRGRSGSSFRDFSKQITAETDFCATCSKNNNFIFTIG